MNKILKGFEDIRPDEPPAWEKRLQTKVMKTREDIGRMAQYLTGKLTDNIMKNIRNLLKKNSEPNVTLDYLKQKLTAYFRIKRYRKSFE